MSDYLRAAFGDRFRCTLIVNYELIASGAPFPLDSLGRYDALLFSPIENKAGYETSALVAACRRSGVPALCFPWIEWHGYHPGATKGFFGGHFRWHYRGLVERAAAHRGGLDAFCDAVLDDFPDDDAIDAVLDDSSTFIRAAEARNGIGPVLSSAVARDFREHRLFLVPDHPSRRLYVEVLAGLLARLGVEDARPRLDALPAVEPQWRWRMPIFPRVARRLGLAFAGGEWIDDDLHPGQTLTPRDYLAQYLAAARADAPAPAA